MPPAVQHVRALENQTTDDAGPAFYVPDRQTGVPTASVTVYIDPASVFAGGSEIFVEVSLDGTTWYEMEGAESSNEGTAYPIDIEAQQIRVSLRNSVGGTDVTVDLAATSLLVAV